MERNRDEELQYVKSLVMDSSPICSFCVRKPLDEGIIFCSGGQNWRMISADKGCFCFSFKILENKLNVKTSTSGDSHRHQLTLDFGG